MIWRFINLKIYVTYKPKHFLSASVVVELSSIWFYVRVRKLYACSVVCCFPISHIQTHTSCHNPHGTTSTRLGISQNLWIVMRHWVPCDLGLTKWGLSSFRSGLLEKLERMCVYLCPQVIWQSSSLSSAMYVFVRLNTYCLVFRMLVCTQELHKYILETELMSVCQGKNSFKVEMSP